MIAALRRVRRAAGLLLQLTALAGGPGFTLLEAYEHAHRSAPGHGRLAHFEPGGGQDHDDVCRLWRSSAPARTPDLAPATVRVPDPSFTPSPGCFTAPLSRLRHRLPPARAPPPLIR